MRKGKTAIFIDGSNLYATHKKLSALNGHRDINYKLLIKVFGDEIINAYYFSAVESKPDNSLIPLLDWLSYNGYTVVRKPTKEFFDQATGRTKIKGNMDIEIAVMAMEIAERVDNIVLFTGDGDFLMLAQALQRKGVFVTVVSSIMTQPSMIADELRRAANMFIEINTLPIFSNSEEPRPKDKSRYG